ncbi:Proton pump-interactor BIP103 [Camellia lanceoleosa]|uniref:Proton pump-interactor BIP103 n=1 Tax=Camellia lanceoleosa TaxID=1840588 RepID=A0ACC0IYU0_9ERIC|nr:Proton pump-interactor BIP103 [Camellia lanceoleosa]
MQVNMEVLEADFMQMALKEEIEAQDNCLDDEKEFGLISSSRDDQHLIQVNFTKDIHDTEKLIQKKNEAYSQIAEKLLERTADRDLVILKLRNLHWNYSKYALSWRRNEMETLQECLKEFQPSKNPNPSRGRDSQRVIIGKSSPPGYRVISKFEHQPLQYSNSFWLRKNEVENLQNCLLELHHSKNLIRARKAIVKSLNYKMQHGSNSLAEEKKLLREIKQNEAKMDNIKLNNNSNNNNVNHASEAAQIRYCLGSRKDIQAYIQFIRNELEGLQEEDRKHTANIQRQKRELKAIERNISSLRNKLADINREKHEACECLIQLKKKGGDKEATKLPPM